MATSDIQSSDSFARTGVPGLDEVLAGGLTRNRLYLIDGDPGAGKTTLAIQFLLEGRDRGERGLYVTLAETREELHDVAKSHGWSMEGIDLLEVIAGDESLDPERQVTMFHPSEVELSETTKTILDAVERVRPSRIVIDSLSELRLLAQHSLRYRRQILALKRFFMGRESTVMLLDDRTADAADRQPYSIAHGVIVLDQLAPHYGAERRRLRVTKYRGSRFRGGYHDFIIRGGGLEVFPRLRASKGVGQPVRAALESGRAELDKLLGGGLTRGTSTLIVGPAGSGKSTIVMQYLLAACQRGETAALFLFDESMSTMCDRMRGLCAPVDRFIEDGKLIVQEIDPAELSPGQFAHAVRAAVEASGATLIAIDSLNGYLHAMPGENYLTIQLHELLTFLGQRGVTTLMILTQAGMMGPSMTSPVDVSYLADSVILLRYFEDRGRVRKAVSVVKKRTGAHEDTIRELTMTPRGLTIGPALADFRGVLTGVPVRLAEEGSHAGGGK